jgi:hypothetical protein
MVVGVYAPPHSRHLARPAIGTANLKRARRRWSARAQYLKKKSALTDVITTFCTVDGILPLLLHCGLHRSGRRDDALSPGCIPQSGVMHSLVQSHRTHDGTFYCLRFVSSLVLMALILRITIAVFLT